MPAGYIQFGPISEYRTTRLVYENRLPVPKGGWCIVCVAVQTRYRQQGVATRLVRAAVKDIKIEPLRSMPVPEYLKPEKEFLFIEMEKVSGKDVAEKASTLLQKNRGLTWRLEKVSSRGRNLLWPRDYSKWMRKVRDSIAK